MTRFPLLRTAQLHFSIDGPDLLPLVRLPQLNDLRVPRAPSQRSPAVAGLPAALAAIKDAVRLLPPTMRANDCLQSSFAPQLRSLWLNGCADLSVDHVRLLRPPMCVCLPSLAFLQHSSQLERLTLMSCTEIIAADLLGCLLTSPLLALLKLHLARAPILRFCTMNRRALRIAVCWIRSSLAPSFLP